MPNKPRNEWAAADGIATLVVDTISAEAQCLGCYWHHEVYDGKNPQAAAAKAARRHILATEPRPHKVEVRLVRVFTYGKAKSGA